MSLTGKIGKYQNDISSLDKLSINRYERLFKLYTKETEGKNFYYYNILNKIEIPENIQSDILDLYTVKTREPFTIVSYNIYETIYNWWLIYLLNRDVIGNKFYVEAGTQLKYILPDSIDLIFNEITNLTVFDNRHF